MPQDKIILVKKKDGTFARMKLSDLKKSPVLVEDKKKEAPVKISEKKNILTKEDIKSPLEDEELKNLDYQTFNKRTDEAGEIINKLSFKFVEQAKNNIKNTLVLFLKDIKSEEQAIEILRQPVYLGGADLNTEQLKELFRIAREKLTQIATQKHDLTEPLKKVAPRINLPMKEGEILPSSSSPFNAFVHKPAFNRKVKEIKSLDEMMENAEIGEEDISKMIKFGKPAKTTVEDIISPKNINYGPIDEIRSFTLTDFRRLSSEAKEAVTRLRQKFANLKEESFLLYLEAIEVWQQSPLYKKYMERICESLNKNLRLSGLVKKEDDLTEEEIKLLVKMEKDL